MQYNNLWKQGRMVLFKFLLSHYKFFPDYLEIHIYSVTGWRTNIVLTVYRVFV
jgi:hypothetical protein